MKTKTFLFLAAFLTSFASLSAQNGAESALYDNFLNPPRTARPLVWWHWMNGNITKDGIRKDLLWMNRSGIGGFHAFDGQLAMRQVVKRVPFMSDEWKDAFHSAIALGDSLGMEMTVASSPGWSETGGPWVKPDDAMKRLSWRHIDIVGGKKVVITLPEGYRNLGSFQDDHYDDSFEVLKNVAKTRLYKDIVVLAVKMPAECRLLEELNPTITTSGGTASLESLIDDNINDYTLLSPDNNGGCWVQYEFAEPQTIRSVSLSLTRESGGNGDILRTLQCSDDGEKFRTIDTIADQKCVQLTHNITPTKARFFRLCLKDTKRQSPQKFKISMFAPSTVNVVESLGDKTGFTTNSLVNNIPTPATSLAVNESDVVDVTKHVRNGVLSWKAPAGRWRILRIGYGLTGKANHPAVIEGTGLEVDKLDPDAVTRYYETLIAMYKDASKGLIGEKGISHVLNDSYEAGTQTWTANMMTEFKRRRGYDLKPWLPALMGVVIGSGEQTEQFLFDWRMTIADMYADYSYDLVTKLLDRHGLKRYTESHGGHRAFIGDGMDCKRNAAVPMSEFWARYKQGWPERCGENSDIRESASVAHIYGQNINAAESFSCDGFNEGAFVFHPGMLKRCADHAFSCGLNRIVVHESAHQPVDDKIPGIGLGRWGQWFNRHEVWSGMASAWTDYLARTSHMLQQGRFVADVAVYYGEDTNAAAVFYDKEPPVPGGYAYDFVNPYILNKVVKAVDGCLLTESGMRYRVLYLANVDYMSLPMLRCLARLADAGVTICGGKPSRMANLKGDVDEFNRLVNHIWESGKTNVTSGVPLKNVLSDLGIEPDVEWTPAADDVKYVHRTLPEGEAYWLNNASDSRRAIDFSFRTNGKKPVIWHPETGATESVAYLVSGNRTIVKTTMEPRDAFFVMFIEPTAETRHSLPAPIETAVVALDAPWKVAFQPNRGAPADTLMTRLAPLNESETFGIKYFSGTATYTTTFTFDTDTQADGDAKYLLDLGEVCNIARVTLNGQLVGTLWHTPFKADVTSLLRKGDNVLQVEVANVWHNRIVGDLQPEATKKITFYSKTFFTPKEPLLPSGLIGPVKIMRTTFHSMP